MGKKRFESKLAAYLILERERAGRRQILVQLRQNTGYMDGEYDVSCSGHVEERESFAEAIVREAKEEIGINVELCDLEFATVIHQCRERDNYYVDVFFRTNKYTGEPRICEPEKCGDLKWVDEDDLPENMIPRLRKVLRCVREGVQFDDNDFTFLEKLKI